MYLNAKKYLKENKIFIGLLLVFLIVKSLSLFDYHLPIWDEAVYVAMGKYLFSLGKIGLWEPIRPVLLPVLLGFLWKVNLNPIFWGELLIVVLSTSVLFLTYSLAKEIFNKRIGLFSMVLVGITPVFYLYSSYLLTGIIATFFVLLSLYFLLKNNFWLAGLFSGLAFLTKFPAGLVIVGVAGVLLIKFHLERENKKNLFDYRKYVLIFVLVQAPFLIFNFLIYYTQTPILVAIFRPYIMAVSHQNSIFNAVSITGLGSMIYNYLFYFIELFRQNWLLSFSIVGLVFWIYKKEYKNYQKNLIFIPLICFIFYFSIILNKQLRFSLLFLPMISIAGGVGINSFYEKIKNQKKLLYVFAFLIVFFALMTPALNQNLTYAGWRHKVEPPIATDYYKFLGDKKADLVLTTDPVPAAYVDKKFAVLYHDLDTAVKEYSKNIDQASYIIYFEDFYPCLDKKCKLKKELLFKYISRERLVFNGTYGEGLNRNEYLIFEVI